MRKFTIAILLAVCASLPAQVYNPYPGKLVPAGGPGGGATELDGLTDVAVGTSPPGTCTDNTLYLDTGAATPEERVLICNSNTWYPLGDVAAGDYIDKTGRTISVSSSVVIYSSSTSDASGACTAGREWHLNTSSGALFWCQSSGTWMEVVTRTGTQTLTGKTLTNPSLGAAPSAVTVTVANASSTGTTANKLAKLTGAPSTAVIAGTSDTGGIIGVVTSGAGTTGNAEVTRTGTATCAFDAATTAGNYVKISASVAGDCSDAGATRPTSGQIIGRVLETIGSAGNAAVLLSGPELQGGSGGSGGSALISGAVTATGVGQGVTRYGFGNTTTVDATETNRQMPVPRAGTLKNLTVKLLTIATMPSGQNMSITVRVNGADSSPAITCTVNGTGSGGETCSDTSNSVAVSAGDLISFKFITSGGTGFVYPSWSLSFE